MSFSVTFFSCLSSTLQATRCRLHHFVSDVPLFVFMNSTPLHSWVIYCMTSSDMLHLICSALGSSFSPSSAVCEPVSPFPFVSSPRPFYSGCFCLLVFSFLWLLELLTLQTWHFSICMYGLVSFNRLYLWLLKRYWSMVGPPGFYFCVTFRFSSLLLLFVLTFVPLLILLSHPQTEKFSLIVHFKLFIVFSGCKLHVDPPMNAVLVGCKPIKSSVGSFP